MSQQKDIRFTEKKVDETWKGQMTGAQSAVPDPTEGKQKSSKAFLGLVQSLGFQTLMHLGAVLNPVTNETELNLDAAKETIDLLMALRDKAKGNLSTEEKQLLEGLLSELQIKFSQSI